MVARELFVGLVDDAALFPPGNAPMGEALAEHAGHRGAWYADLIGPFLCPASRVDDLVDELPADRQLVVVLVVDVSGDGAHQALRAVAADPRLTLVAVEAAQVALGEDTAAVGGNLTRLPGVTGYLEVPRTGFEAALELVGQTGWHAAKYRTGATTAAGFPAEDELAAFIRAVTERGLPFKLTAGLHRAVRHTDPVTGFEHHGVLNVLVATRVGQQGGSPVEVTSVLTERDSAVLVEFVREWDAAGCADVRTALRSIGCCGVTDPIHELADLGLVEWASP